MEKKIIAPHCFVEQRMDAKEYNKWIALRRWVKDEQEEGR